MRSQSDIFSSMTEAQKKRLGELMMKDLANPASPQQTSVLEQRLQQLQGKANPPSTAEELLAGIEHLQETVRAKREADTMREVERLFNREELFRFAYVPFVIAELVWDYADTVILMARSVGRHETRRLSRAIRQAREEYDHLRRQHIDSEHCERELDNGYLFEDYVKNITAQMLLNVKIDINSEYPELNDASRDLLLATYQCHILSRALLQYIEKQRQEASRRIGTSVGNMLPLSYYVMDKLIAEFIGDKPASAHFKKLMEQYISTLSVQIALVGLNDITENQEKI